MEKLIGRERECEELEWALKSQRSELVVLYGRRRVGKTFLVRRFFGDTYSFHYVGAHKQKKEVQLQNFKEALERFSGNQDIPEFGNWHEAFQQLAEYLGNCADKRKILFFDEMPWMDTKGSEFVDELEYFWANWVQNRDDIVFIACGSATSWMKEKLEENQGGLHNRITHRIYLRPFYLNECKVYLEEHGFEWSDYQILQCYMIFGGVPYYLSLLRPYLSLSENVDTLIFRRGGDLSDEFKELYSALFSKADRYISIVKLLSKKREGFTRSEIELSTGFSGGGLTKMLDNLERCDFIVSYAQFGHKTKMTLYRLSDFYTLFYFRYVEDNRSRDEQYWQHHHTDRSVESWEGFTFEEICLRHLSHIKYGLGISGIATESSSWRYVPKKEDSRSGAQVDLVIKRADRIIHLVEMKFSEASYNVTKEYEDKLQQRKALFIEATGTTHNVVHTFITPSGVSRGIHSSFIHSQLTSKHLFASLP
ncbi:MAG: ATP-binding protein [Bacteroidales bacterium]|jgi:AAA+ ATPase superfamily predicted ATPase|nr:ATP-binding protein [Bacteroidales bacterium]